MERIRHVVQPTLAIFGEYSSCLTTLRGLMKNLPNCKNVIVPGAGHFHPVLKPETFVAGAETVHPEPGRLSYGALADMELRRN